jgi:hypothetical protein
LLLTFSLALQLALLLGEVIMGILDRFWLPPYWKVTVTLKGTPKFTFVFFSRISLTRLEIEGEARRIAEEGLNLGLAKKIEIEEISLDEGVN